MAVKVLPTIDQLPEPLRRFMDRLSEEQKLLLVLKKELYDGDWQPMLTDLKNRLDGQPYIIRLASRITDDLRRIEQMQEMERHYRVDLAEYVQGLQETEIPS